MTLGQTGHRNNRLDARRMYQLVKMVEARYAASGMNDAEFARAVEPELGFAVTDTNVSTARGIAGLANNQPNPGAPTASELRSRLARIEDELGALRANQDKLDDRLALYARKLDKLIELAQPVVPRLKEHVEARP